jgi:type IV pilus assembly protein PilB
MTRLLGEQLVQKGLISSEQLRTAIEKQRLSGRLLGEVLMEDGMVTELQLVEALSEQLEIPFVDVESYEIEQTVLSRFPEQFLREHLAIPLFEVNKVVTVAMADPLDVRTVDRLRYLSRCEIDPAFGTPTAITKALDRCYGTAGSIDDVIKELQAPGALSRSAPTSPSGPPAVREPIPATREQIEGLVAAADQIPIIRLVNSILTQAVEQRASDIHLEPEEQTCHLRYRVDGILYDAPPPQKHLEAAITSRFKIMSGLDIAERRIPQDGRFQVRCGNRDVDFRLSTFPTIYGENVAIRVLDKSAIILSLSQLGFLMETLERFEALITRPNGIILVTGPTGCGKTTTLYGVLRTIDAVQRNVITLEDPVEYRITRVRQSQIDVKAGLTFANGLRSIVRQDPDVIMIGEIRDLETAEIAIQAALTGHVVFSTLHTNDAPGALTRLIDMGVEPFLVGSSVIGVLAQRLVRTLCASCKEPSHPSHEALETLGLTELPQGSSVSRAKGCDDCTQTGYRGRAGLFELLETTEPIREMTLRKAASTELRAQAVRDGMMTLRQAGVAKVLAGVTTIEEVLRVTERSLPA